MPDEVIDVESLKRLLEVIGGDPEDLQELLEDFEQDAPKTLKEMSEAAQSNDLNKLRILSHALKSNARDFGAVGLARACEKLEHDCKEDAVDDANMRVDEISALLTNAREALANVSI